MQGIIEDFDDLTASEAYKAIQENSYSLQTSDSGETQKVRYASNVIDLLSIERFVEKVITTDALGFERKDYSFVNGVTRVEFRTLELGSYFKLVRTFISTVFAHEQFYIYSARVMLFLESCKELQLTPLMFYDPYFYFDKLTKYEAEVFNDLIKFVRQGSRSSAFKNRLAQRKSQAKANYREYSNYVDGLFARRAKLLVLRIDLAYHETITVNGVKQAQFVTLEQANQDFKRFKANWRHNGLFKNLYGFIWKLEFGHDKGYHYHWILFLLGSEHRSDVFIAQEIGEYWEYRVTGNRGTYFNCNGKKHEYRYLGIGMLDTNSRTFAQMRHNLDVHVLTYLTKAEQYLALKLSKGCKTIGRGEPPPINKVGRPRHAASAKMRPKIESTALRSSRLRRLRKGQ